MEEEEEGEGEEEVRDGRSRRCVAMNWLAPLPPGPVAKDGAISVSPGWGRRGVVVMRSVFREPIIRMDILVVWERRWVKVERGSGRGRWRGRLRW